MCRHMERQNLEGQSKQRDKDIEGMSMSLPYFYARNHPDPEIGTLGMYMHANRDT